MHNGIEQPRVPCSIHGRHQNLREAAVRRWIVLLHTLVPEIKLMSFDVINVLVERMGEHGLCLGVEELIENFTVGLGEGTAA